MDDGRMALALAVLAGMGVRQVELSLNGGGDSGDCEIEQVLFQDGREAADLPRVAVGFDNRSVLELRDLVIDLAAELPDGDWVNNEGGRGNVTLLPLEADEDEQVSCHMEYGSEDDGAEDDFEDDEMDDMPAYVEAALPEDGALPTIAMAAVLRDAIGALA